MNEFINQLVAHRGYRAHYPGNTLISIQAALKTGTRHLEFDLQMNADKALVLLHDDNFLKNANLAQSVFDTTSEQLTDISVHEPKRFGNKFQPEPVPLLRDILRECLPCSNVQLHVEVKKESLKHWGVETVMAQLLEDLKDYPNPCCMISYSEAAIQYVQENSDIPCGYILKKYNDKFLKRAIELSPEYLICNQRKIPEQENLLQGSWQWMLYGIKTTSQIRYFKQKGCDLFETDFIGEMIDELSTTEPREKINQMA